MFVRVLSALALVLLSSTAFSQQSENGNQSRKLLVAVSHTGDDSVGVQLAFAVREAIRRSAAFELTSDSVAALFTVSLVTADPESGSASGRRTAGAVVFTMRNLLPFAKNDPQTWYPIYLMGHVVIVAANKVNDSAQELLASLDAQIENFKRESRRE